MVDQRLIDQFEKETGKNAYWRGRITKQFREWLSDLSENNKGVVQASPKKEDSSSIIDEAKQI